MVVYKDKFGKQRAELIEVKPKREALAENAKSKKDKAALTVNRAKWLAALLYCKTHGFTFRLMTEDQLYINKGKNIGRRK